MLKTWTFTKWKNVCRCLALHRLKHGPISIALDHSPSARMIVILTKGPILWRCQSPYHRHQWQTCLCAGTVYPRSCFQQFTRFPLLKRPLFVNIPLWVVWWASVQYGSPCSSLLLIPRAQRYLTFRFGFHRAFWCSGGKHVRTPYAASRDQIHHRLWFCCDSFFTCIFSCSFRHHFKTIGGTEMADVEQTQKMIPFITCEISRCQYVCELVFGVKCIWFGFLDPKLILSNNQSRATLCVLETCLMVGLLPLWSSWSLLRCLQRYTTKLPDKKNARLRK